MKSTIFAIALLASGAALAQTYPSTTPPPEPTTTGPAAPAIMTPPAETAVPPAMTTQAAPVPQTVAPGNTAPEHDARGIAVISDPATAPAGFNQPAVANAGMGGPLIENPALPTQPADQSYPPCSRTVTDNCVQTYERGRSPQ
jgi:hypothetical protein